jgi:isocitrate dehydrogenase kinase/phosphatase
MSKEKPKTEKSPPKPETTTSDVPFEFEPVKKVPQRKYRKGSKYDTILESFMESDHSLVKVEVPDKDANYIRTQLNKRLEALKLQGKVEISVVNDICYLEKK